MSSDFSIVVFILTGFALAWWIMALFMNANDERIDRFIREEIEKRGYEPVEINMPGPLDTGPFPKIEISFVTFSPRERTYFRRVIVRKLGSDREREVWIKCSRNFFFTTFKSIPELPLKNG